MTRRGSCRVWNNLRVQRLGFRFEGLDKLPTGIRAVAAF